MEKNCTGIIRRKFKIFLEGISGRIPEKISGDIPKDFSFKIYLKVS